MKFWFVVGRWSNDSKGTPMELCFYEDEPAAGTLYFGRETTLFTTYSRAKAAIARTERSHRKPDLHYSVERGSVL